MVRFEDMQVEWLAPDALVPYEGNAKKNTREQMDAVKASIEEFWFRIPIIAWHDDQDRPVIVAGHARAKAADELGLESVPVVFCDDLDDAQRRALTIVDNQTTMMTGWDFDELGKEIDALCSDFDMSAFGFDMAIEGDIDNLFTEVGVEPKEEATDKKTATCPNCGETFEL